MNEIPRHVAGAKPDTLSPAGTAERRASAAKRGSGLGCDGGFDDGLARCAVRASLSRSSTPTGRASRNGWQHAPTLVLVTAPVRHVAAAAAGLAGCARRRAGVVRVPASDRSTLASAQPGRLVECRAGGSQLDGEGDAQEGRHWVIRGPCRTGAVAPALATRRCHACASRPPTSAKLALHTSC